MYKDPFLTKQLIAYIGNKRSLLPFLARVIKGLDLPSEVKFADPFAGSGAVSRLAKFMGFKVFTNDWEYYSEVVNSCYISCNKSDMESMFPEYGGYKGVFKKFENLSNEFNPYISKYYSPRDTNMADYFTERLFYTYENGVYIDRARTLIEEMYPKEQSNPIRDLEKSILISSLLYEVSTHANTSGVFKACHKGFGGHGKDALGRIMAPMSMEIPYLLNSPYKNTVSRMDALDFVRKTPCDICYLDPPYNTHQYGSNYFMLNTVALWDKPLVNSQRDKSGRLKEKAGIRKDWVNTKSPYCYKKKAEEAFRELVSNIDSRYIILSYNTEGIIPFEALYSIMEEQGKVSLHVQDYILYRGGKQSLERKNNNMELLLVLDRKTTPEKKDRDNVQRFLKERKILNLLKGSFSPSRLEKEFEIFNETCVLSSQIKGLETFKEYSFLDNLPSFKSLANNELDKIYNSLINAQVLNNFEESQILLDLLAKENNTRDINKLGKRFLVIFKKLAFKKYSREFYLILNLVRDLIKEREDLGFLESKIDEIKGLAEMRIKG